MAAVAGTVTTITSASSYYNTGIKSAKPASELGIASITQVSGRKGTRTGIPGPTIVWKTYYNRVYDAIAGGTVAWTSLGSPDSTGRFYPGPGVFGTNTSQYAVTSVRTY